MKIGIIGAGIAGLTAGRVLARAGHDVMVYEKSKGYGGRMSTRRANGSAGSSKHKMDHGTPYLSGSSPEFQAFLAELEEKKIITKWNDTFSGYADGSIVLEVPGQETKTRYIASDGMNTIGKYLGRWLDFHMGEQIGGITHIGGSRIKKSPWMINASTINVFEADAVIIATPAIQAYGLIGTAQDELEMRRLISMLDDINYTSTFSFMAGYGERDPVKWSAIISEHPVISWICNESSKRDTAGELNLVAHTSDAFTKKIFDDYDRAQVNEQIMAALGEILGAWAARPQWHTSHLWRYKTPKKSLDMPFFESEDEHAPLAVIGDYFQGTSLEAAYLSGLRLGEHWAEKLS